VEEVGPRWNENTRKSKSTYEIGKKMAFPGNNFVLPNLKDNESPRVLLETGVLHDSCTINVIRKLTEMILTLSEETWQLCKGKEVLKIEIKTISGFWLLRLNPDQIYSLEDLVLPQTALFEFTVNKAATMSSKHDDDDDETNV
jgi:hypothetical protein